AEAMKLAAAQGAGGGAMVLQRLKAMDKDGDGKVSKQEFTGPEGLFGRLDANNDGFITKEEAESFRPAGGLGGGAGAGQGSERFKALDKNGDGKLSKDEFPGRPQGFERLDTNKDGFLSPDELRALRPGAAGKGEDN